MEIEEIKNLQKIINYVSKISSFSKLHWIEHWKRVEKNGILLAKNNSEVNLKVVRYFAYLHDSCRKSDDEDLLHGKYSSKLCEKLRSTLLKDLTNQEFYQLKTACEFHTIKSYIGDITIDTCFDADRLDLTRVWIKPISEKMATKKGKFFAENRDQYKLSLILMSLS